MLPVGTTWPDDFILGRTSKVPIFILGEAPGEREEKEGKPFVGYSGQELTLMLQQAGIDRRDCALGNVFRFRPPGNNIDSFCCTKKDLPPDYTYPPLSTGRYVKPEWIPELDHLMADLCRARPNVVVALGNTPLWALTGRTGIGKARGAIASAPFLGGISWKILPTYHPAYILRSWDDRPYAVFDLMKAARESLFPEIRRPKREIWLDPTLEDVRRFIHRFILTEDGRQLCPVLGEDIETIPRRGLISCVALSPSPALSLVIPFIDERRPGHHYWSEEEEAAVDLELDRVHRAVPIVGQNFGYDFRWLWDVKHRPRYAQDTMTMHHALYQEAPKALDFLGSLYTDELAWKLDRPKGYHSFKREE